MFCVQNLEVTCPKLMSRAGPELRPGYLCDVKAGLPENPKSERNLKMPRKKQGVLWTLDLSKTKAEKGHVF